MALCPECKRQTIDTLYRQGRYQSFCRECYGYYDGTDKEWIDAVEKLERLYKKREEDVIEWLKRNQPRR